MFFLFKAKELINIADILVEHNPLKVIDKLEEIKDKLFAK